MIWKIPKRVNIEILDNYKSQISELKEYNKILNSRLEEIREKNKQLEQNLIKFEMQEKELITLKNIQENFDKLHDEVVNSQYKRIKELVAQNQKLISWKEKKEVSLSLADLKIKEAKKEVYILEKRSKNKLKKVEIQIARKKKKLSEIENKIKEYNIQLKQYQNEISELISLTKNKTEE